MMTDTELRIKGVQILAQYLGDIEMERFIALIQREPFDLTIPTGDKRSIAIEPSKTSAWERWN